MNWLITGGCGFIGTSLIRYLMAEGGHCMRVVDNLSIGTRADLAQVCRYTEHAADSVPGAFDAQRVQLVPGDILDETLALKLGAGADVILHLAANTGVGPSVEDPRTDCVTNVIGTLNYLESARVNSVRRFVFASSGAPVGECDPPIHEEKVPHPVSPYGASKLAGEGYCSAYFRSYGVQTVALRFGNVYGPGSGHKNSVVAKFIRQVMAGIPLEIYGDGTQTRDFIFVEDLALAISRAATVPGIGGELFQVATNRETTLSEMADILTSVLASAGYAGIHVSRVAPRQGDVLRNFSDTSKARRLLGWEARVDLREGLKRTVLSFAPQKTDA